MKYKSKVVFITSGPCGDTESRYIVSKKKHWWNRWKPVKEGGVPKLFTADEVMKSEYK